jgi:hypothetical protein
MFDELKKYKNKGHFFYESGNSLNEITKEVPDLPGVFYILRLARGGIDIVYIEATGTIQQNKKFKTEGLRTCLNKEQDGMKRQMLFEMKCALENIDALDINWFVTFDKSHKDLPRFVEGLIMQRFFEVYNRLPLWNDVY